GCASARKGERSRRFSGIGFVEIEVDLDAAHADCGLAQLAEGERDHDDGDDGQAAEAEPLQGADASDRYTFGRWPFAVADQPLDPADEAGRDHAAAQHQGEADHGQAMKLKRSLARYTRRGVEEGAFVFLSGWHKEHWFKK